MAIVKPERPGGFLDFLPGEFVLREALLLKIATVFRSFGYDPIETPIIEFDKVLSGEHSDTGKNIFRIAQGEGNEGLALRFDQTVPFARLLAANPYNPNKKSGIRLPWRRMVVGPVFRGESPQSGRYRQFYQFDMDIAGSSSMVADAEIITLMFATMQALSIDDYQIKINNRKILNGLTKNLLSGKTRGGVPEEDILLYVIRTLDKIDKIGKTEVYRELSRPPTTPLDPCPNLAEDKIRLLDQFFSISGGNLTKLQMAKELLQDSAIAQEGIGELMEIFEYLAAANVPQEKIHVDFSVARGLDYYTGPVMELNLTKALEFGSVFSGGRYNSLVSRFTGEELPSVGASVGVDRLFAALKHLGALPTVGPLVDVFILRLAPNRDRDYIQLAQTIRGCGFTTEISLEDDTTFKCQFNRALSRSPRFAVICGGDEFAQEIVQVKNLVTREQVKVPLCEVGQYFNGLKT